MLRTITPLAADLYLHLSNDRYYIDIICGGRAGFRIASEQKIMGYCVLASLERAFMQRNTTVGYYYVLVVDNTLSWVVYCVKSLEREEPGQVYKGRFMSEREEIKRLVGLHEVDGKLLLIFDNFYLSYLYLPKQLSNNTSQINKQFVPYGQQPRYEHQPFSFNRGFLPNQQELDLKLTYYSSVNQDLGMLFVVFQSKTSHLSSVYTVQYDRHRGYLLSGRNVLLNISGKILSILPTDANDVYLVQTTANTLVWTIQFKDKQAAFQIDGDTFESCLTKYPHKNEIVYSGVTKQNKILLISYNKKQSKLKKTALTMNNPNNISILELYFNPKTQEYYILTKKQQFYLLSRDHSQKIIANQLTKIVKSHLIITPTHNFLIVDKQRGAQFQKVVFGNHLFTYQAEHYSHAMMLNSSNLLSFGSDPELCFGYLSSPLLGIAKLNIALKKQQDNKQSKSKLTVKGESLPSPLYFELNIDKTPKIVNEQTCFLNQKYQITQYQIIQFGKKTVKVSAMFQNATENISQALVLSNQFIVLAVCQQIHVFDTKFVRKYIYCFSSQIKNIYSLNDINVLGVQLYEPSLNSQSNQLTVLVLQQEKASKLKQIPISDIFRYIQLSSVINTSQYKLNVFGERLIICSNDSLHRYQIEKIAVQDYLFPLPQSNMQRMDIIPLLNFSRDKSIVDFLVIYRQEPLNIQKQFDQVQVYFGSFASKYLFKKIQFKNIYVNYQRVLTLTELPRDQPIFAAVHTYQQGLIKSTYKSLLILGERCISICAIKFGKIQLQWLSNTTYLKNQIQKIQKISQQIVVAAQLLPIVKPINLLTTSKKQYFLIYNSKQIYYAFFQLNKMSTISYYSLINDQFATFRNNLAVTELNDPEFMANFSEKMLIKGIKYVSDAIIFVLYEYCIVVLEVGLNNSLVVRQQIKFRSSEAIQLIKIQQFLQNYDEESVYLKESHGRIYLLKKVQNAYEIIFHSYLDEDVLLFSRLNYWHKRDRTYYLQASAMKKDYEQLILKKDSQLVVKSLQDKQQSNKMVYL